MGLAGTFNFYASTLTGGKANPPLVISSTGGIVGSNNLGISIGTATINSWLTASSVTISGQLQASTVRASLFQFPDGSQITTTTAGSFAEISIATTNLFSQLNSTAVSLSQLWSSALSSWTALSATATAFISFQTAANSTMTAISLSTTTLYTNQKSTGVSLSQLWTSALSTYTVLTSTAVQLSNFILTANSTMTALSASTTTLALATATLQAITASLTISTTAIGTSTTSLSSRVDSYINANSTVSTRIDQLQVFASTSQARDAATTASTSTLGMRLSSGAVSIYLNGVFQGNATTINFSTNSILSCTGSTCTVVFIATAALGGATSNFIPIFVDNQSKLYISSFNFPSNEFTRFVDGSSMTLTISGTTHTWTAAQTLSSATASSLSVLGNLFVSGSVSFVNDLSVDDEITAVSVSTYPKLSLTDANQAWKFSTRMATNTGRNMLVIREATGGYERMQIDPSSGNFVIGGDRVGGLNAFLPSSAKLSVVGGSVSIQGANAELSVRGLIKTTSGYIFPDGSTQTTAFTGFTGGGGVLISAVDSENILAITTMNFLSTQFNYSDAGSSRSFSLNPSSVTLAGPILLQNNIWFGNQLFSASTFTALKVGTGTILGQLGDLHINKTAMSQGTASFVLSGDVSGGTQGSWMMRTVRNSQNTDLKLLPIQDDGSDTSQDAIYIQRAGLKYGFGSTFYPGNLPSSKYDFTEGSITVRGTNAGLLAHGPIQSTSGGFIFPDGTTQSTAFVSTDTFTSVPYTWRGLQTFAASVNISTSTAANAHVVSFDGNNLNFTMPKISPSTYGTRLQGISFASDDFFNGGGPLTWTTYGETVDSVSRFGWRESLDGIQYLAISKGTALNSGYGISIGNASMVHSTSAIVPHYISIKASTIAVSGGNMNITGNAGDGIAATYLVGGIGIFTSSLSATQFNGYTLWHASGTLTGGTSIQIAIPNQTNIFAPQAWQVGSSSYSLLVDEWKSSFTVTNTGADSQRFWSRWLGK